MNEIIDKQRFGRRLKSARVDAGFDSMVALANAIQDLTGLQIASPTLYSYESGRTLPSLPVLLALVAVLHPYDGLDYFKVAVRSDIAEAVFNRP